MRAQIKNQSYELELGKLVFFAGLELKLVLEKAKGVLSLP